jgi:hypothetical protein
MANKRYSVWTATVITLLAISHPALGRSKASARVLEDLALIDSVAHAHEYLERLRPPCLPASLREKLISGLPVADDVGPSAEGRAKLAALDPVLEYHGRKSVYEVKVIHVIQAFIGLHAHSVLLISEHALEMLTAEELGAAVAHEIGHEYFWGEYQEARKCNNPEKLQVPGDERPDLDGLPVARQRAHGGGIRPGIHPLDGHIGAFVAVDDLEHCAAEGKLRGRSRPVEVGQRQAGIIVLIGDGMLLPRRGLRNLAAHVIHYASGIHYMDAWTRGPSAQCLEECMGKHSLPEVVSFVRSLGRAAPEEIQKRAVSAAAQV